MTKFDEKQKTIEKYNQHIEEVIRNILKEQLLVYNVQQGWEPLCRFLNVNVPDEPFPHLNIRRNIQRKLRDVKQGVPDDLMH